MKKRVELILLASAQPEPENRVLIYAALNPVTNEIQSSFEHAENCRNSSKCQYPGQSERL